MLYIIRFLVDAVYALALCLGYYFVQVFGMKYMFTDLYIANLFCGFIGVAVVVFVFSKLKGTIIFFVKAVTLYAVATHTKASEAFPNVMHKLIGVLGVAATTKLLTEAIDDVQTALMGENPSDKITEMFPILQNLPFEFIINLLVKYYAKSFTYLDECILAYSFAMDKPIVKSLKDAFMQFLKKSHVIMTKLILANVTMTVINIAIAVVGLIVYFTKFVVSFKSILIFYIVIRTIMYIADDAFMEPLLMQNVIADYVEDMPSAEEELEKNMSALVDSAEADDGELGDEASTVEPAQDVDTNADQVMSELNKLLQLPAVKRLMSMNEEKNKKKGGNAA